MPRKKTEYKPDYVFKNGDKVIIGFRLYQILDNQMKRVMDFIDVENSKLFYIEPGREFTYFLDGACKS